MMRVWPFKLVFDAVTGVYRREPDGDEPFIAGAEPLTVIDASGRRWAFNVESVSAREEGILEISGSLRRFYPGERPALREEG